MNREIIEVYVTKYALTKGIISVKGWLENPDDPSTSCFFPAPGQVICNIVPSGQWSMVYDEARVLAERARLREIERLMKRIRFLEDLRF